MRAMHTMKAELHSGRPSRLEMRRETKVRRKESDAPS